MTIPQTNLIIASMFQIEPDLESLPFPYRNIFRTNLVGHASQLVVVSDELLILADF